MNEEKEEKRTWMEKIRDRPKGKVVRVVFVALYIILLIFLIGSYITTEDSQIADKYGIFKDILTIILAIAGVAIAALGYVIYLFMLEQAQTSLDKWEKQVESRMKEWEKQVNSSIKKREEEFLDYTTSMLFTNIGYIYWMNYGITRDKKQLGDAIGITERAYERLRTLDEKEPRNEVLKCEVMNNLGYYLAERKKPEDREFARECAEFIKKRIGKYPKKRKSWQHTYDHIIRTWGLLGI